MTEFEEKQLAESKKIRRDVSEIEGWMFPIFIMLFLIWLRGCK